MWDRVRKLFQFADVDYSKLVFNNSIQPTFLCNPKPSSGYLRQQFDLSSTDQTIYTCPTGFVVRIKAFYRAGTTGTTTFWIGSTSTGGQINAGTSSAQVFCDLLLLPGEILLAKTTSNGADTAIYVSILYEIEPLYLHTAAVTYGTTTLQGEYGTGTGA